MHGPTHLSFPLPPQFEHFTVGIQLSGRNSNGRCSTGVCPGTKRVWDAQSAIHWAERDQPKDLQLKLEVFLGEIVAIGRIVLRIDKDAPRRLPINLKAVKVGKSIVQ